MYLVLANSPFAWSGCISGLQFFGISSNELRKTHNTQAGFDFEHILFEKVKNLPHFNNSTSSQQSVCVHVTFASFLFEVGVKFPKLDCLRTHYDTVYVSTGHQRPS